MDELPWRAVALAVFTDPAAVRRAAPLAAALPIVLAGCCLIADPSCGDGANAPGVSGDWPLASVDGGSIPRTIDRGPTRDPYLLAARLRFLEGNIYVLTQQWAPYTNVLGTHQEIFRTPSHVENTDGEYRVSGDSVFTAQGNTGVRRGKWLDVKASALPGHAFRYVRP